jgi:acyl transferase domain-containing protein/acyl carrier protein
VSKTEDSLEGIAVIGLTGRFPGAESVEQFWRNLRDGEECIHRFTDQELEALGITPDVYKHPNYVKAGTVLENADRFDAGFFGFYPKEATIREPQHRVFLECAWEALENAGYDADSYKGQIGVFAGCSANYYGRKIPFDSDPTLVAEAYQREMANEKDYLCTLVAYKLGLRGPAMTIQTACSTSLVAVCMACQSLMTYQCDMALAGGVCVNTRQRGGYFYQEGLIPSPDGHCRAFDAKAKGTVLGQGAGIVVLKRLQEALSDGDKICAVIKGFAVNNDGSEKVGFTAPGVNGQAEVIAMAQALSGFSPETISYIEAHGTGTPLGDPIEVAALNKAFREYTEKNSFCAIGSLKTNLGHMDAAAGVAGLIKTILMLENREIPPSLHFETPNPEIDFDNSPFYVNTKLRKWVADGSPLRAGVSAFGLGGTNAHVVLEEAPTMEASGKSRDYQLVLISAKTETGLKRATENLAGYLDGEGEWSFPDVAYTLQVGRKGFSHRRMVVCKDAEGAVSALKELDASRVWSSYQEQRDPPVVFMFPGQGSQYVNMGLGLYRGEREFREEVDRCSEMLKGHLSLDLRDLLYPAEGDIEEAAQKLGETYLTQPALFTVEYALAKLWMSWGVKPSALVGHSIGEYVAACLSGVFSLEDALTLVAWRGRLIQDLPGGFMLAVRLSEKETEPYLREGISLSAINSPVFCVVSGEKGAIEKLEREFLEKGVNYRLLHTSHAFHSKMIDPILEKFAERVRRAGMNAPQIPFLSNVTGTWIRPEEATNPGYWVRHLRETVRFAECVGELLREGRRVFLEVGPGNTLMTLSRQHGAVSKERIILTSVRHPQERVSDIEHVLKTLGRLWLAGVEVDWTGFYRDERRCRVSLPTYPFERQRYWMEAAERPRGVPALRSRLSKEQEHSKGESLPNKGNRFGASGGSTMDRGVPYARTSPAAPQVVKPRNDVEKSLVGIWKNLFGLERIGIYDNYFQLGGDSLMAVQLFTQIEKRFGKKIPLASLLEAPTIERLAAILIDPDWSSQWSSLVEIQPTGSNPPLFLVHGAGGTILIYRDLAMRLGPDQPCYGLQAQGIPGNKPFLTRVEDMASLYIDEIRKIRPKGPYLLGGYCLGGTIAFEMAQQLYKQGQKEILVFLMETYNFWSIRDESLSEKTRYHLQRAKFHLLNFLLLGAKEKTRFLIEKAKVAKNRTSVWQGMLASKFGLRLDEGNGLSLSLSRLWETNDQAAVDYVPRIYPGKVTQFLPVKDYHRYCDQRASYSGLAAGGVETRRLPVYPAGMLVEPFVKILAEELSGAIRRTLPLS